MELYKVSAPYLAICHVQSSLRGLIADSSSYAHVSYNFTVLVQFHRPQSVFGWHLVASEDICFQEKKTKTKNLKLLEYYLLSDK